MCEKCGNFDKMRMYVEAPFSEEESEILRSQLNLDTACVPKDWRCIDCKARCWPRDHSLFLGIMSGMSSQLD